MLLSLLSVLLLQGCNKPIFHRAELIEQNSKSKEAASLNMQLGMEYLKQGDTIRAKKKLFKALAENPHSADINSALGYFFEKTKDTVNAEKYYHQAFKLAPNQGAQLNNYGAYLCRIGHYSQSEPYFLKAVQDVNYMNTANAYENAGFCMLSIPNYTRAGWYFKKALDKDPKRKQSLYELASIAIKQKNDNKALRYFQKYQTMVFSDPVLLKIAMNAAKRQHMNELEATYRSHLSSTGEKYEHNNNSG